MTDSFANYPRSISEIRATRSANGAGEWTPRDALIACLRALDEGRIAPDALCIIAADTDDETERTKFDYWICAQSSLELLGMLSVAIQDAHERQR